MDNLARVYDLNGNTFNPSILDGNIKYKKDGTPKRTRSNAKAGRSTWVDPIRDIKDVKRMIVYLMKRVYETERIDHKRGKARNLMYFCIGIGSGFRASDLIRLRWNDIFMEDGVTFQDSVKVKEKKTGKMKLITLNRLSKDAIRRYVKEFSPDTTSNDYLFINRSGKRISSHTVDDFIKEAAYACNLEGNYSTHSIRKTYAYQRYMALENAGDKLALEKVSSYLNHANMSDTYRYLGLDRKQELEDNVIVEKYFENMLT